MKQEIPFGAFDSELMHQEINIPEGFEAEIKGNKIILKNIESEDKRIRKEIIAFIKSVAYAKMDDVKRYVAWVEKQGELVNFLSKGLDNAHKRIDELIQKNNELCIKLEKQGEQEQLYIRFGEIPTDEKSKIYRGEMKVGTENGVSVYPAFKTDEGDIVLGLNLPITKTTLYTQQHLIEYDDRPCYLVKGDYVGKDTDGQPLINNVSIIEKIDSYRVKEEKADKVEPKFKVGDFIANDYCFGKVIEITNDAYLLDTGQGIPLSCEHNAHLWTIQDAKDGDVLAEDTCTFIINKLNRDLSAEIYCCLYDDGDFETNTTLVFDDTSTYPATKEQRDLLFQKIKEVGYEWDAEKKELEKQGEQRAAWSEEDETKLKSACALIKNTSLNGNEGIVDSTIDWLKSLKDRVQHQNHWKPSDEQMEALFVLLPTVSYGKNPAFSLYNDLKKLKGE